MKRILTAIFLIIVVLLLPKFSYAELVSFTRSSTAYKSDGTSVANDVPRYETGHSGQAVMVEEGTANLITNPSFEIDTSGWDIWNDNGTYTFQRTNEWSKFGSYSLKAGPGASDDFASVQSSYFSINAGEAFSISAFVKPINNNCIVTIGAYFNDGGTYREIIPYVTYNLAQGVEQRIQASISSSAYTASNAYVEISIYGSGNLAYIDGVQIEKKPYITSFTDSTRADETLALSTTGVLSPNEGTVEFTMIPKDIPNEWARLFQWGGGWTPDPVTEDDFRIRWGTGDGLNGLYLEVVQANVGTEACWVGLPQDLQIGKPYYVAARWRLPGYIELDVYDYTNHLFYTNSKNTSITPAFSGYTTAYLGNDNGNGPTNCLFDDFRTYTRALTDAEITAIYEHETAAPDCNLNLKFDNNLNSSLELRVLPLYPNENQIILKETDINFQWIGCDPNGYSLTYTLQVGTASGGSDVYDASVAGATSKNGISTAWNKGKYYWRVITDNGHGGIITSAEATFIIGDALLTRYSTAYKSDGTSVGNDVPRYEAGHSGQAVTVEEGTTNMIVDGRPGSIVNYTAEGGDASVEYVTKDGLEAIKCMATTYETTWGAFWCNISTLPAFDTSKTYTASFEIKLEGSVTFDDLAFQIIDDDAANNVTDIVLSSPLVSKTDLGNGWYRIEYTFTPNCEGSEREYRIYEDIQAFTTTFYWRKLQLEEKPYATSFTDSHRSDETLTVPITGRLNPSEGTVEFTMIPKGTPEQWACLFQWGGGWTPDPVTKDDFCISWNTGDGLNLIGFHMAQANEGTAYCEVTLPQDLQAGKPYYVAARWQLPGYIKLDVYDYTNHLVYTDTTNTSITPAFSGYTAAYLGNDIIYDDGSTNCLLDDFRTYSRALTDVETAASYTNRVIAPNCSLNLNFDNNLNSVPNNNPTITLSSPFTDETVSAAAGYNTITFSGRLCDPDNNNVTVSAAINGVTKTTTVSPAPTFDPGSDNWTLSWDVAADNIAEGSYTNIIVTADDGNGGTATATYANTITVDTMSPTVSTSNIADGQTGVAVNQPITITFSENIYPGTAYTDIAVNQSVYDEVYGTQYIQVPITANILGSILTITPDTQLDQMTTYTVEIPASSVIDAVYNNLSAQYIFAFTTGDFSAPTITGVTQGVTYNVAVTPIFTEGTATLNGQSYTSGTPITQNGAYTLAVTDTSGNTTTVTFTVYIPSANANLAGMTISAGTLNPAFSPAQTTYTAAVLSSTSAITVTPTAEDANAQIQVNGVITPSGSQSHTITLTTGENTITVLLTAEDTITTKIYTITITKQAATTYTPSPVIQPEPLPPPVPSVPSGTTIGSTNNTITLTIPEGAAAVYYTLDGSEPTSDSPIYTGTIAIDGTDGQTITIKTAAYDDKGNKGEVGTYTYTIDKTGPQAPTVSQPEGEYKAGEKITITPADDAEVKTEQQNNKQKEIEQIIEQVLNSRPNTHDYGSTAQELQNNTEKPQTNNSQEQTQMQVDAGQAYQIQQRQNNRQNIQKTNTNSSNVEQDEKQGKIALTKEDQEKRTKKVITTVAVGGAAAAGAAAIAIATGAMGAAAGAGVAGATAAAGTASAVGTGTAATTAAGTTLIGNVMSTATSTTFDITRSAVGWIRRIKKYRKRVLYKNYRRAEKLKRGLTVDIDSIGEINEKQLKKSRFTFVRINTDISRLFEQTSEEKNQTMIEELAQTIERITKKLAVSLKLDLNRETVEKEEYQNILLRQVESLAGYLNKYNASRLFIEVPYIPEITDKLIRAVRKEMPRHTIILGGIEINKLLGMPRPKDRNMIYGYNITESKVEIPRMKIVLKGIYRWSNTNKVPVIAEINSFEDKKWLKRLRVMLKRYVMGWTLPDRLEKLDSITARTLKLKIDNSKANTE